MLMLLLCCLFQDKPNIVMRNAQELVVGAEYYVGISGESFNSTSAKKIAVCRLALFCEEYLKYVVADDEVGIREMVQGGKINGADHCSKIKILQESKIPFKDNVIVEVRFLDGNLKDKKGWVFKPHIVLPVDLTKEEMLAKEAQERADKEAKKKADADKLQKEKEKAEKAERMKVEREQQESIERVKNELKQAEDEVKAADLLKYAKRWLSQGDKDVAKRRLDEILKRFPNSKVAPEAKKLKEKLEGK